jgi:hypothetical protein
MTAVQCPGCGAKFCCDPGPNCWCMQMPPQAMPENAAACFCPACLKARIGDGVQTVSAASVAPGERDAQAKGTR